MVKLWGYEVYENGDIITPKGKKLNKINSIKIKWNNKEFKSISYARFIYYAFHQNFDVDNRLVVIAVKNGKINDFNINNLIAINKREIVQGENNKATKLSDKQVVEIIEKYKRCNGNNINHNSDKKVSYRTLANEYGVSHALISGIIKNRFRNKNNYIIKEVK